MRSDDERHPSYLSRTSLPSLSLRTRVCHPNTRTYVRLLGPCFKTGHLEPFRQASQPRPPTNAPHVARHDTQQRNKLRPPSRTPHAARGDRAALTFLGRTHGAAARAVTAGGEAGSPSLSALSRVHQPMLTSTTTHAPPADAAGRNMGCKPHWFQTVSF